MCLPLLVCVFPFHGPCRASPGKSADGYVPASMWRYTGRMKNEMETAIVYILLKEGSSLKENNEDPRLSLPQESTLKP